MYHRGTFSFLKCTNMVDSGAFGFGLPETPFFYIAVDNRPVLHDPRPKAGACSPESSHRGTHRERERELTFQTSSSADEYVRCHCWRGKLTEGSGSARRGSVEARQPGQSNGLGAPLSLGRFRHYIPRRRSSLVNHCHSHCRIVNPCSVVKVCRKGTEFTACLLVHYEGRSCLSAQIALSLYLPFCLFRFVYSLSTVHISGEDLIVCKRCEVKRMIEQ